MSNIRNLSLRRRVAIGAMGVVLVLTSLAAPADAGPKKSKKADGPTELVVKVRWGSDPALVMADLDATIVDTLVSSRRVLLVEVDDSDAKKAIKRLEGDRRIKWAEQNFVGGAPEGDGFHAWRGQTRPKAAVAKDRTTQPVVSELDLVDVHKSATGAGVKIAILDTGIDASHPDLAGHVKRRLDLIDGDFNPDDVGNGIDDDGDGQVDEAVGHGTHIAGIVRLVAPDATILSYRVLDSDGRGTVFGVAEAIRHAVDDGADVINLSFGSKDKLDSTVLKDAIKYAKDSQVIIVAAAGNEGSGHKRYPAADGDVVAVGAYDISADELAKFANHGKWVKFAAPGTNITSTVPDGRYATWSGSSMAAPFVSAQVALLLEVNPNDPPKEIMKLIGDTATKAHGKKIEKGFIDLSESINKARR